MTAILEDEWATRILLFLYKNESVHKDKLSSMMNIRPATLKKRLESFQEAGLIVQVEERYGKRKTTAHVQKLTLEGRKVAEHLQEIDKIINKKTVMNPTN